MLCVCVIIIFFHFNSFSSRIDLCIIKWQDTLPNVKTTKRNCLLSVSVVIVMLETVQLLAASVVSSRLLTSGDVERNPGPGTL